jgi:hypothetical protein
MIRFLWYLKMGKIVIDGLKNLKNLPIKDILSSGK